MKKENLRKSIFSVLGFGSVAITIWEAAMAFNALEFTTVLFLSAIALFCAAMSYRLYVVSQKARTEIFVATVMINICLIGFILIACVNTAIISPDPYSYRMPIELYLTAWAFFAIGGVCSVAIQNANKDEVNSLVLKAIGVEKP